MPTRQDRGFRFPLQKYSDEKALYTNFRYIQDYLNYIRKLDRSGFTSIVARDGTAVNKHQADFVADGTNDHTQIQAAIDRIPSGTRGVVYLGEGTYNISASLSTNGRSVHMWGPGVLNFTGGTTAFGAGFSSIDGQDLFLDGLEITGAVKENASTGDELVFAGGGEVWVANCYIHDFECSSLVGIVTATSDEGRGMVVNNHIKTITLTGANTASSQNGLLVTGDNAGTDLNGIVANNLVGAMTINSGPGKSFYLGYGHESTDRILVIGNMVDTITGTLDAAAGAFAKAAHNYIAGTLEPGDHGNVAHDELAGLGDDDHTQYLNSSRHDSEDHSTALSTATLDDLSDVTAHTPTKGNILVADGDSWEVLGTGSNDEVLTLDSAETLGVKWAAASGGGGGTSGGAGAFRKIETQALSSSVTSVTFSDIPSWAKELLIVGNATKTGDSSSLLRDLRVSWNGNTGSADYEYYAHDEYDDATVQDNSGTLDGVRAAGIGETYSAFRIEIYDVQADEGKPTVQGMAWVHTSGVSPDHGIRMGGGTTTLTAAAITSVKLTVGGGVSMNAGQFTLYAWSDNGLNFGDAEELTIATGAITATQGFHTVDTEADAATDDLDTINGGTTGDALILRTASDARDVTLKDGTGNLSLRGDITLKSTSDTVSLLYDGSNWLEIARSVDSSEGLIAYTRYEPVSQTTKTDTTTSLTDIDATNLAVTFTAPDSGTVLVKLRAAAFTGTTAAPYCMWGLRESTTDVGDEQVVGPASTFAMPSQAVLEVSGLTPGSSHTYKWAHRGTSTADSISTRYGGDFGPAFMEVWAT